MVLVTTNNINYDPENNNTVLFNADDLKAIADYLQLDTDEQSALLNKTIDIEERGKIQNYIIEYLREYHPAIFADSLKRAVKDLNII